MVQCYRHVVARQGNPTNDQGLADQIHQACRDHLKWCYEIAEFTDTWASLYTVSGKGLGPVLHTSRISQATQGSFQFRKLCLYYRTWKENWAFVLDLLHLIIKQWLNYLDASRHMGNLWVERVHTEVFKPHDTSPGDVETIRQYYPFYVLSDATEVWLALVQLEELVNSIEEQIHSRAQQYGDHRSRMAEELRAWFNEYQHTLSSQKVRSNILDTFTLASPKASSVKRSLGGTTNVVPDESQRTSVGVLDHGLTFIEQDVERGRPKQSPTKDNRAKQAVILQRNVKEHTFHFDSDDLSVIEAANLGFFSGPEDSVDAAWRATLNMQKKRDALNFSKPHGIALALFASKFKLLLGRSLGGKLEDVLTERLHAALYDSGFFANTIVEDSSSQFDGLANTTYEAMSLLLAKLSEKCCEVL